MRGLVKVLILGVILVTSSATANAQVFGHDETKYDDIKDFKKWKDVIKKVELDNIVNGPVTRKWKADIARIGAENPTREGKIKAVNDYFNKTIIYAEDIDVWHVSDYWTSPTEVLTKGHGDCEDYAIAKFYSLKLLGLTDDEMRLVVLNDQRKNELHAILVIDNNAGAKYVLDNQSKDVKLDTQVSYYMPIYSINEHNWWKHS